MGRPSTEFLIFVLFVIASYAALELVHVAVMRGRFSVRTFLFLTAMAAVAVATGYRL